MVCLVFADLAVLFRRDHSRDDGEKIVSSGWFANHGRKACVEHLWFIHHSTGDEDHRCITSHPDLFQQIPRCYYSNSKEGDGMHCYDIPVDVGFHELLETAHSVCNCGDRVTSALKRLFQDVSSAVVTFNYQHVQWFFPVS